MFSKSIPTTFFTNNAGNLFEQYLYINRQSAKIIID